MTNQRPSHIGGRAFSIKYDMIEKIKDIALLVKWANISKEYFGKSSSWIYQRISGYDVNGKPAQFTEAEKAQLREALHDLARRIDSAADSI